jgi:hypothetical protein
MKPTIVIVHTSESRYFPGFDHTFPFAEFEHLAFQAALDNQGHEDTDMTVYFDDGMEYNINLCLGKGCNMGFQDHARMFPTKIPEGTKANVEVSEIVGFLGKINFATH